MILLNFISNNNLTNKFYVSLLLNPTKPDAVQFKLGKGRSDIKEISTVCQSVYQGLPFSPRSLSKV